MVRSRPSLLLNPRRPIEEAMPRRGRARGKVKIQWIIDNKRNKTALKRRLPVVVKKASGYPCSATSPSASWHIVLARPSQWFGLRRGRLPMSWGSRETFLSWTGQQVGEHRLHQPDEWEVESEDVQSLAAKTRGGDQETLIEPTPLVFQLDFG
jgi:hypothetical protein